MENQIEIDERMGRTSASNAEADDRCRARHLAQLGLPDSLEAKEYRDTGKRVHAALAAGNPEGLTQPEFTTYEACRDLEIKMLKECFGPDFEKVKTIREQRFWAKFKDPASGQLLEHSGKPDVVHVHATKGLIVEYKALYGDVPVSPQNLQLRDQVCLVRGKFVTLNEVWAVVIQPLVTMDPVPCKYSLEDIKVSEQRMFHRVAASNQLDAPRSAGEYQCNFCRAKLQCVEYQKFIAPMVPAMMDLMNVPVSEWTPDIRAAWCSRYKVAKKAIDAIETEMKRLLELDPNAVPGFWLKPGAKREIIVNVNSVFERFVKLGGTQEQFLPCVSITKTKLKDILAQATAAKGKTLELSLTVLLDGLTRTEQNAPSLTAKGSAE